MHTPLASFVEPSGHWVLLVTQLPFASGVVPSGQTTVPGPGRKFTNVQLTVSPAATSMLAVRSGTEDVVLPVGSVQSMTVSV
jgi:hypothetical protein